MLFTTISQGWLFLLFLSFGFAINFILLSPTLIKFKKHSTKNVIPNILVAVLIIFNSAIWWWLNLKFNYGQFRFYLLVAYFSGLWLTSTIFKYINKNKLNNDKIASR